MALLGTFVDACTVGLKPCPFHHTAQVEFLDQFSICFKTCCICSPVCTTRWHRRILSQALRAAYAGGHETWCTHSVARCCGALQLDLGPPDAATGRFASAASAGLWNQRWGHALEAGQGVPMMCLESVRYVPNITKLVSICLDASLELDFLVRFEVKFKFKCVVGWQFLPSGKGLETVKAS